MSRTPRFHRTLTARLMVSSWLATLALPAANVSARVMSPDPLVVVIESEFDGTDPAAVRDAIAATLGAPVLRLTDSGVNEARGTLSIAFSADGRHAYIYFRLASGDEAAVIVEVVAGRGADAEGVWAAEPAAAAVRTLDRWDDLSLVNEVLDPWLQERVQPTAIGEIEMLPELSDPFAGEPTRDVTIAVGRYYYGSELINPWLRASNPESAQRLSPPRPAPN